MGHYLKQAEYYEFVRWTALPFFLRTPSDQQAFQMQWKVSADTLARWKKDPNFWEDVRREIREWAKDKTPEVIAGILKAAVKGNPISQKLWMQIFEGFEEKSQQTHEMGSTFFEAMKLRHEKQFQSRQPNPAGSFPVGDGTEAHSR